MELSQLLVRKSLVPFPHGANDIYTHINTVHSAIQHYPEHYKLKYVATRVGRQQVMIWLFYPRTQYNMYMYYWVRVLLGI